MPQPKAITLLLSSQRSRKVGPCSGFGQRYGISGGNVYYCATFTMYGRAQAVILLVISAACCGAASTLIRGASPDNIEKYTPKDGKFTCFDGSLTIDFSQASAPAPIHLCNAGVPAAHSCCWCFCR